MLLQLHRQRDPQLPLPSSSYCHPSSSSFRPPLLFPDYSYLDILVAVVDILDNHLAVVLGMAVEGEEESHRCHYMEALQHNILPITHGMNLGLKGKPEAPSMTGR